MFTRRALIKSLAALPFMGWINKPESVTVYKIKVGGDPPPTPLTVLSVWNTSEIGKPVRVFDAAGVEHHHCYECIVETGQITKAVVDKYGPVVECQCILRQTIFAPAPLRIEPAPTTEELIAQRAEFNQRFIVGPKITVLDKRVQ